MNVTLNSRNTVSTFAACIVSLALGACATDAVIYEPPTEEPTSTVTFVNGSDNQNGTFVAFQDARACTGRQTIQFDKDKTIPAGNSRSTRVAAGSEFAFFASLNTVESEDYAIELGVTGSGPEPVLSKRFSAIGCHSIVSFTVEQDKDYYIVLSGPESAGSCAVSVSEIYSGGMVLPVKARKRASRETWGQPKSYCEPLIDP